MMTFPDSSVQNVCNAVTGVVRAVVQSEDFKLHQAALVQSGVSSGVASALFGCVTARREELVDALRDDALHMGGTYLKDFDWSLRMTVASSKLANMQSPNLLVSLQLAEPGMPPEASLPLTVQLGPAELDNLIERLEEAAQVQARLTV